MVTRAARERARATGDAKKGAHLALEDELRALKDTIVDGLIIIDADKKVLSFNPAASRIFGYAASEVIGRNVKMLMPEPFHAEHDVYVDNYRRTGEAKIIGIGREVTGRRKDGSIFPMYLSVGEMENAGTRQFVGIVRDLTDVNSTKKLIEGVASNLPGPIFRRVQHPDGTLSFTYVSEGLRREFDLDPDSVISDPGYLMRAIHPDDRRGWCNALQASADTMAPYDFQMRVIGENGQTKWMQAIAHPYRANSDLIVWDGLAVDITTQKQAELERAESADQIRHLLESVPDAMWITQLTEIVYANPAAANLFGFGNSSELMGMDYISFLHPEDRDEAMRQRKTMVKDGTTPMATLRCIRPDEQIVYTETNAINMTWQGEPATLLIARDISRRMKAEAQMRQSQKMEAIGQLTGGVAHDFNNLLAVLMMDLEELSSLPRDQEQMEDLLREAREITQSASELTSRLLASSRQQDLRAERVDIRETIGQCVSLLRRTIGEHIDLNIIEPVNIWPAIVDSRQLENALLNLAVNARDAMPSGGSITIKSRNVVFDVDRSETILDLPDGEYLRIDVTDTGTGIPGDILDKIFDPFFTTKDVGSGTGLGLSMVHGFAKQSGGDVAITSEVGRGTTISLYLPRAPSDETTGPTPSKDKAAHPVDQSFTETILLVEDFPQLRKRGAQMLTGLGCRVIQAENGQHALVELETAERVDLLFTDIVMPGGMNGFELAKIARKRQPGIKVVYTSGYAEGAAIEMKTIDEVVPRLLKPYSRQDLAQTIRRALDTP